MYETVDLNIIPVGEMPVVHCSQYDTNRLIRFVLTDGEDPFTFGGVLVSVTTTIRKVDGTLWKYEDNAPVLVSNRYEIATDEQMTACAGNNYGELTIKYRDPDVSEDEIKISTLNFILKVELSPETGGLVSQSEINNLDSQIALVVDQQLDNYYTKSEIDDQIEDIVTEQVTPIVSGIVAEQVPPIVAAELGNYYTKSETDNYFYNKTETDTLLDGKANTSDLPDMDDYYTKSDTDILLSGKVSNSTLSNYYTKPEVDALVGTFDIINNVTGTIVTFNDGGDNIPVKSLATNIVAVQSGTGTPSPDNIRAITGVDTVDVIACGKNFTQITETTDSHNGITYTFNNDGTISASGSVPSGNSYKNVGHFILQAGTYTISGLPSSLVAEARKCAMVLCKDAYSGSVNIIKTIIALSDQFTLTEATDCYLRIYVYVAAGAISDVIFAPQIELGTSATSFEKFKGTTHTITLPETIYKGEVDVANGKGTKLFNAVDLGDLTYTYDSVNRRMTATLSDLKSTGTRATSFICSCFQTIDDGRELVNVPNNSVYSGNVGNLNVYFQTSDYTDPAAFKTAMTGQTLVYPIEDVSIDLAPVKIPTLAGLNNIYSNTGDVSVEYFNDKADQLVALYNVLGGH